MENKGYYSMGLCGYEMWLDPDDNDRMMVQFVGTDNEHKPRSYKIQETMSGRMFVRPDGRRIYLDEVLRTNI